MNTPGGRLTLAPQTRHHVECQPGEWNQRKLSEMPQRACARLDHMAQSVNMKEHKGRRVYKCARLEIYGTVVRDGGTERN